MELLVPEKAADMKELSGMIMKHMRRGVVTNCFIGTSAMQKALECGAMYVCHSDTDSLFLLRDFGNAVRMNYYIFPSDSPVIPAFDSDKSVVTEFSVKDFDNVSEGEAYQKCLVEKSGFELYTERIRLDRVASEVFPFVEVQGLSIGVAGKAEAVVVHRIFAESLDPISGCVPLMCELEDEADAGNVLVARADGGDIIGAMLYGTSGKSCQIKLVAVDCRHRGCGAGKALVGHFLSNVACGDKNACVWTGADNFSAIKLYSGFGFCKTSSRSYVYIRNASAL